MADYEDTPARQARRAGPTATFANRADPAMVVAAIIEAATETPARLRVPLGVDTYRDVKAAHEARLAEHEGQ